MILKFGTKLITFRNPYSLICIQVKQQIHINTDILSWAISRAGYKIADLEKKFPRISEWLHQEKFPSLRQLSLIAKSLKIPFGYFFLNEIPKEKEQIPFFRSKGGFVNTSLNVKETVNILKQRQSWLEDYLKEDGFEKLSFVGKYNTDTNYIKFVNDIRKTLKVGKEWARGHKDFDTTLSYITEKIEEAGIIVVFNSVVGNNNSRKIPVDECRGFVLISAYSPFIFINSADYKGAQLFTLIHELAHIWLGAESGVDMNKLIPSNDPIEILCNEIAAEFLVPADIFVRLWNEAPDIDRIAKFFKVSRVVIARRALDLQLMSYSEYEKFYTSTFTDFFRKKEESDSGGQFYSTQKKRLSIKFLGHINTAIKQNRLLYRDAYTLANLQGKTFKNLINKTF